MAGWTIVVLLDSAAPWRFSSPRVNVCFFARFSVLVQSTLSTATGLWSTFRSLSRPEVDPEQKLPFLTVKEDDTNISKASGQLEAKGEDDKINDNRPLRRFVEQMPD
jgi:hypothetical protein